MSDIARTFLITFAVFAQMLAGSSEKTARRRWKEFGRPTYRVGGRTLISLTDANEYIESQRVEVK